MSGGKNGQYGGRVTIRDLIRSALRMRPDRIIVGEVRGGEAVDMLQSLNTGHDGSLSTLHANSSQDMLSRIETMTLMGIDLPLEAIRAESCWKSQKYVDLKTERSRPGRCIAGKKERDL